MRDGGYGLLGGIVLGVVGALVGGSISSVLFGVDVTGFNLSSILIAIIGAVMVIAIYHTCAVTTRARATDDFIEGLTAAASSLCRSSRMHREPGGLITRVHGKSRPL